MHSYSLRSIRNKTFYSKHANTQKYRNWLTNSGVDLWQDIPLEMKKMPYKSFAEKYKQDIIKSY